MFTSGTVIRKAAFEDVGGYDESFAETNEDLDLYLRLSLRWKLVYRRCVVGRYRVWPGNFRPPAHARGIIAAATKHLGLLEEVPDRGQRRAVRYALLRRLAFSNHTLLRGAETRRRVLEAWRTRPTAVLSDPALARILLASGLPRSFLKRRRVAV